MSRWHKTFVAGGVLILALGQVGYGRALFNEDNRTPVTKQQESHKLFSTSEPIFNTAIHDAGDLYAPFLNDFFSIGMSSGIIDPETGLVVKPLTYKKGTGRQYLYQGNIWIGGIVGDDTLVSIGSDGWANNLNEFVPPDLMYSTKRTGNFADDEFETVVVDTFIAVYDDIIYHTPLGIKVTRKTYSWADSLYDDFIFMDYEIENIGENFIEDTWIGIFLDPDIYHISMIFEYGDDLAGSLDTLLYNDDPNSRVFIPYACDNDGDPSGYNSQWLETSVRGALSLRLLETSFDLSRQNFNWWMPSGSQEWDFGPRQVGSEEFPFRPYTSGGLGSPGNDKDRYNMLSYPEVDYDQIERAIHDSTDGWIPLVNYTFPDEGSNDPRFLLSFGSFDLAPGQIESFTAVMVAGDNIHVNPSDFDDNWDALNPDVFYNTLDFSELLLHHRRADSVWKSGYRLPHPGPPVGLKVDSYNAEQVSLIWNKSGRPDLHGYFLFYKDSLIDNDWHRVSPDAISDTTFVFPVSDRGHEHKFAVTLIDSSSRESALSDSISIIPSIPNLITGLSSDVGDDLIPEVSWDNPNDSLIEFFRIYRTNWSNEFLLHDSTSDFYYRDYDTESGGYYRYQVTAVSDLGFESPKVGPVEAVPMAMDRGVLFADLNLKSDYNTFSWDRSYLEDLYQSIASLTRTSQRYWGWGEIEFKDLADHEIVIIDTESRGTNYGWGIFYDYYRLYLENGGKIIFISRGIGNNNAPPVIITQDFSPGDFFYDILKLEGIQHNPLTYHSGGPIMVPGDLTGCLSENIGYPNLETDTVKLRNCVIPGEEYIQMSGFLYPREEAEVLYRYQSSNPDTINHNQVNGIRYLGDDYQFVLLNFPLTLMTEEASFQALYQALYDLGMNVYCGDVDGSGLANVGDIVTIIRHLYYQDPEQLAVPANADVDCDGAINVGDAVSMINFSFKHGVLHCCTE